MTEPGADRPAKTGWRGLKLDVSWLHRWVSGKRIIVAMAALGAAVAIFVFAGGVDISADKPDGWLASHALHFVFKRSIGAGARRVSEPGDVAAASRVRLAAQHFDMVCANCHGRPGFGQSVVALSMNPRPQYLPKVVGQFTDAQLYVTVEHGVKYSAMPSWATDARGDEVWSMVAFLRQLPKLDAKAYRALTALPAAAQGAPTGSGGDAALEPGNERRATPPLDEFLYKSPATGFSDQTIHDNPAATCARCHGADGSGAVTGGEAPNLTIQNAQYLHAALKAYTIGARQSGFMQTIAAELSGEQITALSNYYAGLPVQTPSSPPADPALVKRGETIATQGIRERAIPACANCHESGGSQIVGSPHIAGQSATSLRRQLAAMGHGGRGSAVSWNPMQSIAHALDDKDIAALTAYYSGLKPIKAAVGGRPAPEQQPALPGKDKVDVRAAQEIFGTTCTKCHIDGGRGDLQGDYPNLTIQTAAYAAQSLYAFHTGARLSTKMREVTDSLTLDQMTSLAAYLDTLTPRPARARPDAAAASRGAAIAMNGVADRKVPACLGCHSAKGVAALPLIPPLQGQNAAYLRKKLDYFTKPYPVNDDALNPMPAIARQLTDQQRADLAAYFAGAAPLQKTAARR